MLIPTSRPGCGCLVLCAGIGAFVMAYQEYHLGTKASAEPQKITCRQLADKGPGENLHIILTDFTTPHEVSVVYEQDKYNKDRWTKVWVPLTPNDLPDAPHDFRVILQSDKFHREADVTALEKGGEIHGLVVNDVESLGTEEQKLLRREYPATDLSKCWIIQHDRSPKETTDVLLIVLAGVLGLIAGVALILSGARSKE